MQIVSSNKIPLIFVLFLSLFVSLLSFATYFFLRSETHDDVFRIEKIIKLPKEDLSVKIEGEVSQLPLDSPEPRTVSDSTQESSISETDVDRLFDITGEPAETETNREIFNQEEVMNSSEVMNQEENPVINQTTSRADESSMTQADEGNINISSRFEQFKNRPVVTSVRIKENDSLSRIAKNEWGDVVLWPDLYATNRDTLEGQSPDVIYINQQLKIVERLGQQRGEGASTFTDDEVAYLSEVYLDIYKVYRSSGRGNQKGISYLFFLSQNFNPNFISQNRDEIAPEDIEYFNQLKAQSPLLN